MPDHRLAAIMVTDMVGFTTLMGADQDGAMDLVSRGHDVLRSIVSDHNGEWLDDAGDRSLTVFPSAIDAVHCALKIQSSMRDEPELGFRIGVDIGDILVSEGHAYGDAVNVASFIERLADPDGLVITEATFEAVQGQLDLNVIDLGEKMLKNIPHPVRLYALVGTRKRSRIRNVMSGLTTRRVPQITGAYLAASWAVVEVAEWLAEHGMFGNHWVFAVIVGLLALIPSVFIIAYAHGAHGRDRSTTVEKIGVPINILLAAALVTLVLKNVEAPAGEDPIETASVAVLPFVNLSDADGSDYFSFGLSEELLNALARVPGLYVASRTSSFVFDDHEEDPREIAKKLRVATILEGSVRKDGDHVRVTAQLIDGKNNYHLWSDTFDHDLEEIFEIQEEIAKAVTIQLIGILKPDGLSAVDDKRKETLVAYDFYLQGLNYLRQPPTAETLNNARNLLNRALGEDDRYAKARAALCEVELEQYVLDRSSIAIDVAEAECLEALRLDEASREVRYAMGVLYRHTGDYEESGRLFWELLNEQITPRVWLGLGSTSNAQGDFRPAETYFQNAIDMEPGNWHNRMALAEFFYWHGRYDESLNELLQVVELSPDNVRAHLLMGATYDYLGDTEASLRETMRAIELSPSRGAYRDLGLTYHFIGQYEKAVEAFQHALELGADDHATWGSLGDTYRQINGQETAAFSAYEHAAELAEDLYKINSKDWTTLAKLAVYNVMTGSVEEGMERITTAVANGPHLSRVHLADAVIKTRLNESQQGIDALERAVELGYPKQEVANDPQFNIHKDDERFKRLIGN